MPISLEKILKVVKHGNYRVGVGIHGISIVAGAFRCQGRKVGVAAQRRQAPKPSTLKSGGLVFSPDFDRSLHPFAGQELLSSRSSFILEPLWKSTTWDEDGLARQEPGSNLPPKSPQRSRRPSRRCPRGPCPALNVRRRKPAAMTWRLLLLWLPPPLPARRKAEHHGSERIWAIGLAILCRQCPARSRRLARTFQTGRPRKSSRQDWHLGACRESR